MQYVGQTKQPLHCRLNGHRHSVLKGHLNTYLSNHFKQDHHSWTDVELQIIDHVDDNIYISPEEINRELNRKEDMHIKMLNTLYPLGLNDRVLGGGCVSQQSISNDQFFSYPISRRKRSHGIRKSGRKSSGIMELDNTYQELQDSFETRRMSRFYHHLKSLPKTMLRAILGKTRDEANMMTFVLTAYIQNKLNLDSENKNVKERATIIIPFESQTIDSLNLMSIFCDHSVCKLIPSTIQERYPPKIFYKLDKPTALKFCNYGRFLNNLKFQDVMHIMNNPCSCSKRQSFVYPHYGHVITGDLDIVDDEDLRQLFSFGTKHRIPKSLSWSAITTQISNSLDEHITKISKKERLEATLFSAWKSRIMALIKDRIYLAKKSSNRFRAHSNRHKINVKMGKNLKELQNDVIITPVDKASNNYAFICKKFYLQILLAELGIDISTSNISGNDTYGPEQILAQNVIEQHTTIMKSEFKLSVCEKDRKLPKLYWIPKFHKTPCKFRFIAGARQCTSKKLSIKVNSALSILRDNFQRYCMAIKRNSGFDCFWSIKSTQEFLHRLNSTQVHSLQVFDFSTLYTNLDQKLIEDHIFAIMDLVFNSSNRKFICIGYDKSFCSMKKYSGYHCFDKQKLKEAIHFLLSQTYVTFGNLVFRQIKGIPMGGNSSPLLADLFLLHCEYVFMQNLIKTKKYHLARLLSPTSRYIDDICVVNYKHFNSLIQRIYPPDLLAERNGDNNKEVVYLDVKIQISQNSLRTSVYHKVDDFSFSVVQLTFPESMIPLQMALHVFASQVVRYCRICSKLQDAVHKTNKTLNIMKSRGYSQHDLMSYTEKALTRHNESLHKYGLFSARQFTSLCEFQ